MLITLTAIYDRVPTKELASELISWPLTPKSHNLISPLVFTKILEGLTSANTTEITSWKYRFHKKFFEMFVKQNYAYVIHTAYLPL